MNLRRTLLANVQASPCSFFLFLRLEGTGSRHKQHNIFAFDYRSISGALVTYGPGFMPAVTYAWFHTLFTVLKNSGQPERNVTMKFARLSLSSPPPFRIFRESLGTRLETIRCSCAELRARWCQLGNASIVHVMFM